MLFPVIIHKPGKKGIITGADIGFQVRGGGALKKIAPSGARHDNFWGISCEKSRFCAKKIIFFPILGGARRRAPPPWIRPCIMHMTNIIRFQLQHRYYVTT